MSPVAFPRRLTLALGALALCSPTAPAGGVRIVDPSGLRTFGSIQAAIDAAGDGDVLLIGAGEYEPFTLDGKDLSIVGVTSGGTVSIRGPITVRNVQGRSLLVGLSASPQGVCAPGLVVADCPGLVTFEGCSFQGSNNFQIPTFCPSRAGAEIGSCAAVVLSSCDIRGGNGGFQSGLFAGDGAVGLRVTASTVAAYDSSFRGGRGGNHDEQTGNGGTGCRADGTWLFAAACSIVGGDSGDQFGQPFVFCGDGGNGLEIDAASEAHLLDVACAGGTSGMCDTGPGASGAPISSQGLLDLLPGTARAFALASLSADRAPWSVTASGLAGDQVFLERSLAPVFRYEASLSGVCTAVLPPFAQVAPAGTMPASGSLSFAVRQRLLPDDVLVRVYSVQGRVIASGGVGVLGSPRHVVSLDWDSPPDCNANGLQDYAEVIFGVTPDVDHDLVPDGCP